MRDMKPLPDRDPARAKLAAAIALEAGARRDLQVAEEAAKLAAERCRNARSKLDELRNEPPAPSGAFAAELTASIVTGNPCTTATLERASVAAGAKLAAAENEVAIWNETRQECEIAVRAKEAAVVTAKERVGRAAREIICDSAMSTRLMDDLEMKQAEVIERRVALRFIWSKGLNGELSAPDNDRMERLLMQDLDGLEPHPVRKKWDVAFEELQSNSEAELPS
jgi:hypothetical protein